MFKKSTHFCFAPFWASWRPRNKIKDISVVPCLSSFRKYPCFSILTNNKGGYGQKHVCYTIFSIRNSIWSFLFDFHGFSLPLDARNLLLYGLFIWYLTFFTWSSFQKLGTKFWISDKSIDLSYFEWFGNLELSQLIFYHC